jgi:hypothetical protein
MDKSALINYWRELRGVGPWLLETMATNRLICQISASHPCASAPQDGDLLSIVLFFLLRGGFRSSAGFARCIA